ncbi:MAG TPA: hypothetical protein VG034_13655 [Acidimicrobiia bacterium]|jgi:hypothetical protein|nr:hypothetical protein [Acidimicrobiia bacterium]
MAVGQVACLAAIVLAGRASAERPASGGQGVWVAVAVAAALISAAGNGIWLAVLRRVANGRRQLVFARLGSPADPAMTGPADTAGGFVMVSGLTLRHRPDCPLVAGKAVVPATPDAQPCGWCSA